VIDAHLIVARPGLDALAEFLPAGWREHMLIGGGLAGRGYQFPAAPYRPPARALPDADPAVLLPRLGPDGLAAVDAGLAPALSGIPNQVMAAELARAANDWLAVRLAGQERLRRALVVAPRDAELAAAEIRRGGADASVAMVVLAHPPALLGDRSLRPLFAAAAELDLPVCLHAGGAFAGSNPGPAPVGHPSTYDEYVVAGSFGAIPHVISALAEGLFERFPTLRLLLSGFGVGWLPSLLWRMDARVGVDPGRQPWRADRRPSEVAAEHLRFTTWAVERPAEPGALEALLRAVSAERSLLWASGDAPEEAAGVLEALAADLRQPVGHDNADATLRPRGPQPAPTLAGRP